MNAEERTVLNTVNTNLRVLGKGQTIAKEIVALPQTELEGGWETTLDRIAKKNDIQVRYKDVEEAPISGSHHRLLEVDFMPMVVFSGTGASKKAADSMATKCTLGYLKTQLHVAGPKNSTRQMGKGNERADIAQRETRKPPDNMWAQTSRSAKTQNSKPAAIPTIVDGEEREIVVLNVMDVDNYNKAVSQLEEEPRQQTRRQKTGAGVDMGRGGAPSPQRTLKATGGGTKTIMSATKTKAEYKLQDASQTGYCTSSCPTSWSNLPDA